MSKAKKSHVYSVEQFHAAEQAGTPLPDNATVFWSIPGGGGGACEVGMYRNILAAPQMQTVEMFTVGRHVVEQSSDGHWYVTEDPDEPCTSLQFDDRESALEFALSETAQPAPAFAN
jgi:hypothetical protein